MTVPQQKPKLRGKPVSAGVAVAPAIDLFFLLLVFFMLSNSIVFWPGAKVDTQLRLPRARVNSMRKADKIIITITQSGRLFFNDRDVDWEDLERGLRELLRQSHEASVAAGGGGAADPDRAQPLVVLRADRDIPYQQIIDVMTLARSLELGVYLVTDSQSTSSPPTAPALGDDLE